LGDIERLNKKTGSKKYEKGMRRWSQEERENINNRFEASYSI